MKLCAAHSMPYCRTCGKVEKPAFGTVRKPLRKSKKTAPKMGSDVLVQDSMIGRGRCFVTDAFTTQCDGRTDPAHIIPQRLIRDTFEHGAVTFDGGKTWQPYERSMIDDTTAATFNFNVARRLLDELLRDTRNIIPVCRFHHGHVDQVTLRMVDALGMVGTPDGFDEFCAEYGFVFQGRYWVREPDRKAA